jgi:hypothetical protein
MADGGVLPCVYRDISSFAEEDTERTGDGNKKRISGTGESWNIQMVIFMATGRMCLHFDFAFSAETTVLPVISGCFAGRRNCFTDRERKSIVV